MNAIREMIERQQQEAAKDEARKKQEIHQLFSKDERVHIVVHGNVQGVFFRDFMKKQASALGLVGFVRNKEGTVEIIAEGRRSALEKLVEKAEQGSDAATVERVDVKWQKATHEFSSFEIKH